MKIYEFKLPDIGEGVTEGEIVQWLVTPGEVVREDQPMVEVMTDKATVTITAPKAGKIVETRGAVGGLVPVHSVLVVFDLGGDEAPRLTTPSASSAAPARPKESAATAVGDIKENLPGMDLAHTTPPPAIKPAPAAALPVYFNPKPLATPATRRLARELGFDLRVVSPTGPNGRVTRDDVRGFASATNSPPPVTLGTGAMAAPTGLSDAPPSLRVPQLETRIEAPLPLPPAIDREVKSTAPAPIRIASPTPAQGGSALEERTPLRGVRKRIFDGMTRSKHTAAHFTFVEECDVTALKALRARLKPVAEKSGVKLTFLPFFVKACVAALKRHPTLNSAFDESTQEIVTRRYFNIGIASATEAGLIVPVVRDADKKSLLDIARDIARLGDDTKSGKVKPEDLGNSTFTITSLGQQGGLFATPILNFPEVAILGIHQMKEKPVVRDGQIVIGDVMLLSLSFDHRIIDGHIGAAFAYEIISYLQEPDRLFLEMG
jgi:pyruvate dehydrogenase E2 component (dihydrolipoamide acetyltransferase)